MLRSLKHPSIVEYKQVVADDDNCDIYVVMEYVEYDLHEYMKTPLSLVEVKRLMRELLEGVRFLHRSRVMHRDLKPSNVLVNSKGDLKICDFGMSRHFPTASDPLCSPLVCTLWYRAPELLLGSCTYLAAVDMWSVGCIMAEFFLRKVLFRGESEIQQLGIIISTVLDQPRDQLHDKFDAATSSTGGPVLTEIGFDLLCQLLAYDPQNRISAQDALDHEWFHE
ncbi:cyclin-dependent kinase g-1 [Phtheirospermum japonicum]|uniref:Cyclin-dependent kinase g-1 n=1 Tax=Phtheirospermum japonicum TaxID=374723 RepID=A0A830B5L2_9LAMI|nr:cyclin-dependent kinase g-1 [Phtheirospermum japonicum]